MNCLSEIRKFFDKNTITKDETRIACPILSDRRNNCLDAKLATAVKIGMTSLQSSQLMIFHSRKARLVRTTFPYKTLSLGLFQIQMQHPNLGTENPKLVTE